MAAQSRDLISMRIPKVPDRFASGMTAIIETPNACAPASATRVCRGLPDLRDVAPHSPQSAGPGTMAGAENVFGSSVIDKN